MKVEVIANIKNKINIESQVKISNVIAGGGIVPEGTLDINSNGKYEVSKYKDVKVDVPIPEGYLKPEGSLDINENGKHDVTIYEKVNVNVESDVVQEIDGILARTTTEYYNDRITHLGESALYGNKVLTKLDLPNAVSIGVTALSNCIKITELNLPEAETMGNQSFAGMSAIEKVYLPKIKIGATQGFYRCNKLKVAIFDSITQFKGYFFQSCVLLTTIVIRQSDSVVLLDNTNIFNTATSMLNGTGIIYVPDNLVEQYKAASNWSVYAEQIKPLSEYVEE